jgi:hypothetical protein
MVLIHTESIGYQYFLSYFVDSFLHYLDEAIFVGFEFVLRKCKANCRQNYAIGVIHRRR